ncbi:DUF4231 domain-containing protein [Aetokthonos hydrillicola Thurmond2011]|jgi:hypothetical protein|uniref:DUF4231 domain-containing protein n=1 Tax=Aetokthonos hydrillicola Thurmond2011 TaxID=2712845 RepID=A0AAP5MBX4_9CYAN|nr:DUF4231 domain-containing protein [Aetokthonos hydrillicola]MBO3461992.1 DUF4231 domain-containing protein [Aetokthonos hydrillicola CCALA 1050]MBW4584305.1 DUF4231 domain-containing protein [Aetokthonos hydrillicola CCALA 1050]MDR9898487.1 DUF4231 domain-containing protein [Aetokthonos hydrillicola Thurmond2011]
MTNSETINQKGNFNTQAKLSPSSSSNMSLPLKTAEYLFLSSLVCVSLMTFVFPDKQVLAVWVVAFLSLWLFLALVNKQVFNNVTQTSNQLSISKKAELYNYLASSNSSSLENSSLLPAREKALQYCQDLIEDYKKTRTSARIFYYSLQLITVILSGITPIFVLVDKLESNIPWLKWLPVIFPAIASIVASIATSFPFQENAVAANTTVELLEAEQEKFILGVTELYRAYDIDDEAQRQKQAKQAVENFMIQVNNIHLKQIQGDTKAKTEKTASPEQSSQTS